MSHSSKVLQHSGDLKAKAAAPSCVAGEHDKQSLCLSFPTGQRETLTAGQGECHMKKGGCLEDSHTREPPT